MDENVIEQENTPQQEPTVTEATPTEPDPVPSGEQDFSSLMDAIVAALEPKFGAIASRLDTMEQQQKQTFAAMVQNGGVVRDTGTVEVDAGASGDAMSIEDFDLTM